MNEVCRVAVPASSPACYTVKDDDEPEVIFIADNNSEEEDSRDGEPSSTTIDINGDDAQGDNTDVNDEYIDAGTQLNTIESSDSTDEDEEGSGNVLNNFIRLINLVNSYEKHDSSVKTKFKDGFVFLENLQTQFEETERNVTEMNEMTAELIAENNKLTKDTKQLQGELNTQSLQFGMLKSKYVKFEEEMESLKISDKMAEELPPVQVSVCTNPTLETKKPKADKLQHLFRQLCSNMRQERVYISDPESVRRSKELKSFQNEVGVLFIKVQHKLYKWSKNQVKMEEELERARISLEHLHDIVTTRAKLIPATEEMRSSTVTSESQIKTVTPCKPAAVGESSTSQLASRKRNLPPPPFVPINIPRALKCNSDTPVTPVQEQNIIPRISVPSSPHKTSSHTPPNVESSTPSKDVKTMETSFPYHLLTVFTRKSPPQDMPKQVSPLPAMSMPSAHPIVSKSLSRALPEIRTSDTPTLYQLQPLPPLNFPLSPPTIIVSTSTTTSSSEQLISTVSSSSAPSKAPKVQPQPTETKLKVRRRRGKTLKTAPAQLPQTTSMESRYPIATPQYSQAPYPTHPQYKLYPMSHFTPNGPHQATLQAYQNQMMQLPFSTASQFPPQQQHQISSSAPPVSTQSSISSVSIPETQKQTNVTHLKKC